MVSDWPLQGPRREDTCIQGPCREGMEPVVLCTLECLPCGLQVEPLLVIRLAVDGFLSNP